MNASRHYCDRNVLPFHRNCGVSSGRNSFKKDATQAVYRARHIELIKFPRRAMEPYRTNPFDLPRNIEIAMNSIVVKLSRRVARTLDHSYRHSRVRNAILALRSRKKTEQLFSDCKRFVIFLVPGLDTVNGGVMSICSIASETEKLLAGNRVSRSCLHSVF